MLLLSDLNRGKLNEQIIQQLHRKGVDLLNKAMIRLLSRRERRENEDSLTDEQKKSCRKTTVHLLDIQFANLRRQVSQLVNWYWWCDVITLERI